MRAVSETIAKALAFNALTDRGKRDCTWPDDFGEMEIEKYRSDAQAVMDALAQANVDVLGINPHIPSPQEHDHEDDVR